MNHEPMYMKDWIVEIDDFAKRYGQGILSSAGSVSHQQALEKAEREYQKYRQLTVDELSQAERDYIDSIKTMQKQITVKK